MFNGKKKISFDISEQEYSFLSARTKNEGTSTSAIINSLINIFLHISPEVSKKIGNFCYEQYMQEKSTIEMLSGYKREDSVSRMEQFEKLSVFFGHDTPEDVDSGMTITFLKEGYVIYPKEWIVLGDIFGSPDECMYSGVVESRNSAKFGIPHFIFFTNEKYGCDYTDDMQKKVYDACAKKYPDFKKFWNMQVPIPDLKDENSVAAWRSAPEFALFHIPEKGDPISWPRPDYKPPYGAMIIRDKKEN